MPFTFPKDAGGLAGAVKKFWNSNDFAVPSTPVSGVAHKVTDSPLGAAVTFREQPAVDRIGTGAEILVTRVQYTAFADAAGTLYIEECQTDSATDGDWTVLDTTEVTANTLTQTPWSTLSKRFYRARYVNGAGAQNVFLLYGSAGSGEADIRAADGAIAAVGSTADTAQTDSTQAGTGISWWKGLVKILADVWHDAANALRVVLTNSAGTEIGTAANPIAASVMGSNVSQATLHNAAAAVGDGDVLNVAGLSTCVFTITGTFVGTVTFEGSADDGATWASILTTATGGSGISSTATATGVYRASVGGLTRVRARVSAYTSGAITVKASATIAVADTKAVTLPSVEGTPGSAVPSKVTMLGASDGTLAQGLKVDAQKNLLVGLRNSTNGYEPTIGLSNSDGFGPYLSLYTNGYMHGFNNTSMDRWRNNTEGTLLAGGTARTTTTSSPDQTLYNGRGIDVIIDVTAKGAAPSVVPTIEVKDSVSGKYVTVLTGAAITATGTTRLRVYPGIAAVANVAVNDVMRRTWRLTMTVSNTDSLTYSAGKAELV